MPAFFLLMSYAIISLGGKQYRVREGERLLVDRLPTDEGKTLQPRVLFVGGDGKAEFSPTTAVTARVVAHVLGEKVRIRKVRRRTGYRRHNGYRSRLTQIEIEAIGGAAKKQAARRQKAETAPTVETAPEAQSRIAHPPKGYDELSIAEIKEHVSEWRRPNVEAALAHEKENANRKGAIAALEAALAAKEERG